jgi:pyruvate dehydrogenase E2 component (dihydrolipoamide acetyltransferase)
MHTVVMPKLSDTMEEGKILRWLKQEGDPVAKGDALAEIETEKVNIEVEAFSAGLLRRILVPAGASAPVGAPIALTGTADEPLPAEAAAAASPATAAKMATPTASSSPAAVTVAALSHGQANAEPEVIAPPVAQPATAVLQAAAPFSPASGSNGYNAYNPAGNGHGVVTVVQPAAGGRIFISPVARRIAAEHGLDAAQIQGTGPGGRIIKDDVLAYLQQAPAAQPQPMAVAQPVPAAQAGEEVEAVALSQMRKTIARRLQQSMQTAPHFYVTMAIDVTQLVAFNASANEYAASLPQPVKLTLNDLIVKGVATALVRMPQVNVSFDGDRLLYKKHINVGIAVALDQGLIVPVIRDADKRGVLDLARESRRLVEAARTGKLKPEEFQGGTFSVSNLGMFGVEEFTAIINPPESCILAVGAATPTPVVREGQVVVRDMMKVTLSVDHRALDGATAARFLQDLKRLLEQPLGMVL